MTVIRGLARREISGDEISEYLPDTDPNRRCRYHIAGQEYISVDHGYPEPINDDVKFCSWAFANNQKVFVYHHFEKKRHKMGQPPYAACTDGTAPDIFEIGRIE